MTRPAALLLALLAGCSAPHRVDAVARAESLARHHGALRVGPRLTFPNGTQATVLGGAQTDIYAPGEPAYSARAPDDEFQVEVEISMPIFGRP